MMGEHSLNDSWKKQAVQGHEDVYHAAHDQCDQSPIAMDEVHKCLSEWA